MTRISAVVAKVRGGRASATARITPRPRSSVAVLAVVSVVSLLAGVGLSRFVQSPASAAAAMDPPVPGAITVPVEERVVANVVQVRADIGYEDPVDLLYQPSQNAGAGIVSGQVPAVDDQLEAGSVALEVDGRPVIALPGEVPAYRDLRSGLSGPDVQQLRTALRAVGIDGGSPTKDTYDSTLAAGVKSLFSRAGYQAPDSIGGLTPLPSSEVVFVPSLPRRVDQVTAVRGKPVGSVFAVVSGADIQATGTVSTEDAALLSVGTVGTVTVGDESIDVTIAEINEASTESESGEKKPNPARKELVFSFALPLSDDQVGTLDNTNVRVRIPVSSTDGEVLAVPLAALSAGPDGKSRVEVPDGSGTRTILVTTGLTGEGYVEIVSSVEPLKAGDLVVVGQPKDEAEDAG